MMRDWNIVYPVFLTVSTKWLLVIKEVFISHEWRRYQTRRAQVKRADVVFHLDWPTGCLRALCGMAELPVVIIIFFLFHDSAVCVGLYDSEWCVLFINILK
jgi:hypothetical protein